MCKALLQTRANRCSKPGAIVLKSKDNERKYRQRVKHRNEQVATFAIGIDRRLTIDEA